MPVGNYLSFSLVNFYEVGPLPLQLIQRNPDISSMSNTRADWIWL